MMNNTINYYNMNANDFYESTVDADMSFQYNMFEKYLHNGAHILDLGCGSGRDSKYFLEKGYKVTAIDGSEELCRMASELTGLQVKKMYFHELNYENEFDGVWACASLLHVDGNELPAILRKVCKAMKDKGILYVSFKYGKYIGERNGRLFTDLNEVSLEELIGKISEFQIIEKCITKDVRPERDERWLNAIIVKNGCVN